MQHNASLKKHIKVHRVIVVGKCTRSNSRFYSCFCGLSEAKWFSSSYLFRSGSLTRCASISSTNSRVKPAGIVMSWSVRSRGIGKPVALLQDALKKDKIGSRLKFRGVSKQKGGVG